MVSELMMPKWHDILVAIANCNLRSRYCERIIRKVNASRSHVVRIIQRLHDNGLIIINPGGRIRKIDMTEHGQRVAKSIQELKWNLTAK